MDKVTQAKLNLACDEPWCSRLVYSTKVELLEDCNLLAYTDGKAVFVNKAFADKISVKELQGVIMHELLHIIFLHVNKMKKVDNTILYNVAADAVINWWLLSANYLLPGNVLKLDSLCEEVGLPLKDYAVDELYELLKRKANKVRIKFSEDIKPSDDGLDSDSILSKVDFNGKSTTGLNSKVLPSGNKDIGNIKGEGSSTVNAGKVSKPSWLSYLSVFLSKKAVETSPRPHRRVLAGIYNHYCPSYRSSGLDVVAIVDTSGSVSDEELSLSLGQLYQLVKMYPKCKLTVASADVKVTNVCTIKKASDLYTMTFTGRGGTSYIEPLNWATFADIVVYFTDGYCNEFPEKPPYPLLWVLVGKEVRNSFPYGKVFRYESSAS